MKPFLSFFVILILFQTLFFGSLVKLELPAVYQDQWAITIIHKPLVLDPFLVPGKDGFNPNFQNKNEWVSVHFTNNVLFKNNFTFPNVSNLLTNPGIKNIHSAIPVFIKYGSLRI